MNLISVITTNRTGAVAEITQLLSDHCIDIQAINAQVLGGDGVVQISTKDDQQALELLIASGFQTLTSDLLLIRIEDQPGALAKVSSKLAEQQINIHSMTMIQRQQGYNLVALSTDNNAAASEIVEVIN
jgi:hypothetical protein